MPGPVPFTDFAQALAAARRYQSSALAAVVDYTAAHGEPRDRVVHALLAAAGADGLSIRLIGLLIAHGAVGELADALPDDSDVRRAFILAAAKVGSPAVRPHLMRLADDPHPRVSALARWGLEQLSRFTAPATPAEVTLTPGERSLLNLARGAFDTADVARAVETDAAAFVRDTLEQHPAERAQFLEHVATYALRPSRSLLFVLRSFPSESSIRSLVRFARTDDRPDVIATLGQIADARAVDALIELARSTDGPRLTRTWVALAGSSMPRAVAHASDAYSGLAEPVRRGIAAAWAGGPRMLADDTRTAALELLSRMLQDPSDDVRRVTEESLLWMLRTSEPLRTAWRDGRLPLPDHLSASVQAIARELERTAARAAVPLDDVVSFAREDPRPGRSDAPPDRVDAVDFSVTAPASVRRNQEFLIDVWAYQPVDRKEMLARLEAAYRGLPFVERQEGPVEVARGSDLGLVLDLPGIGVSGMTAALPWHGTVASRAFAVHVPAVCPEGTVVGTVGVFVGGLKIASVLFQLSVGATSAAATEVDQRLVRVLRAFASYAADDREDVLARIQGMRAVVPELDIFLDVVSLRAGDRWLDRVRAEILARDTFYLFWSPAARRSRWVRKEWHLALKERGLDYISPVPLVSPTVAKPPRALASLHFNDWTLAVAGNRARPAGR